MTQEQERTKNLMQLLKLQPSFSEGNTTKN